MHSISCSYIVSKNFLFCSFVLFACSTVSVLPLYFAYAFAGQSILFSEAAAAGVMSGWMCRRVADAASDRQGQVGQRDQGGTRARQWQWGKVGQVWVLQPRSLSGRRRQRRRCCTLARIELDGSILRVWQTQTYANVTTHCYTSPNFVYRLAPTCHISNKYLTLYANKVTQGDVFRRREVHCLGSLAILYQLQRTVL